MATLGWMLAAFAVIALCMIPLHRRAGRSKVFCCALCLAVCGCAVALAAVWQWMPNAHRPVVRLEALRGEYGSESAEDGIWLGNVFGTWGKRQMPVSTKILSGVWARSEDGLRWQAEPAVAGQTDAVEISLQAAERYAFLFWGNRKSGRVLLTYLETGESETIDTYRDSDGFETVIVDIGLNGTGALHRLRWARVVGVAACVAASAALFAALYVGMRNRRPRIRAFAGKLARIGPGRAPMNPHRWRWYTFALCGFFWIPLLRIAAYAQPFWDDFTYGTAARQAWRQTGSLIAVFRAAVGIAKEMYGVWQGTFSVTFLSALHPGIFGARWYGLTTYWMTACLVGSTWFFAATVLGKRHGSVLCWLALFFSIQYAVGVREVLYWFNGGTSYIVFYSLSLVVYSIVLRFHRVSGGGKRAAYTGIACIAAFFLGGGNYVTALLSCVCLTLWSGYRLLQKDRLWWNTLLVTACVAGALILSAAAPGNAARQSGTAGTLHLSLRAIYTSFPYALRYLRDALRGEYVLGAFLALPFLYQAAERSTHAFRYPGLVTIASLCAYACQFTPILALGGTYGPDRLMSIVFFASFWMVGGNLYYWLGWMVRRGKVTEPLRVLTRWVAVMSAVLLVLACAVTALREPLRMNGVTAAASLADGSAKRYGEAQMRRAALYEDETIRDVVVPPLPETVYLLPNAEIEWGSVGWLNDVVAAYYGKDSVSLVWGAE